MNQVRIQQWVVVTASVLFVLKLIAYILTHSVSILTDALESIVNLVAGFIGLYSLHLSAKPRDANHPYGHGKAEFISAAIEGTLIGIAGILIIYEACKQLIHPKPLHQIDTGIYLVSATAIVNYFMGGICIRQGKKLHSPALVASGRHLQTDTLTTGGIVAGLVLLYFTNIQWIDSAVAAIFGFIILFTSWKILRSSIAGIMDEADMELLNEMISKLEKNRNRNWVDLHNLRVIKYGSILHLDCHLTVPWYFNVHESHQEIEALSGIVRKEYGESLELFVHSDGCLPSQCPICIKQDCGVRQHEFVRAVEWKPENVLSNEKHGLSEHFE